MLAFRISGSFAQPSTFTTLALNAPPSATASPRGTTNSAKSITTAMRRGAAVAGPDRAPALAVLAAAAARRCRFSERSR